MDSANSEARLLVVWHSRTGASEAMAHEAAKAASAEITVDLMAAGDVTLDQVLAARAFLFVCPENLGSLSGAMKEFFDRTYYPVLDRVAGRAYGSIIAAGSDGTGAQRQLDRIVTGWRLRRVVDPVIINFEAQTPEAILARKTVSPQDLEICNEIGAALGSGASLGVF